MTAIDRTAPKPLGCVDILRAGSIEFAAIVVIVIRGRADARLGRGGFFDYFVAESDAESLPRQASPANKTPAQILAMRGDVSDGREARRRKNQPRN
jgi:hypothetical protein